MASSRPNRKQIEKLIRQSAKRAIAANGLVASTKRGNKELNHLEPTEVSEDHELAEKTASQSPIALDKSD